MKKSEKDALKKAFNIPEPKNKKAFVLKYNEESKKNRPKFKVPVFFRCTSAAVFAVMFIGIFSYLNKTIDVRNNFNIDEPVITTSVADSNTTKTTVSATSQPITSSQITYIAQEQTVSTEITMSSIYNQITAPNTYITAYYPPATSSSVVITVSTAATTANTTNVTQTTTAVNISPSLTTTTTVIVDSFEPITDTDYEATQVPALAITTDSCYTPPFDGVEPEPSANTTAIPMPITTTSLTHDSNGIDTDKPCDDTTYSTESTSTTTTTTESTTTTTTIFQNPYRKSSP